MRAPPGDLETLVTAVDDGVRERAWAEFLRQRSDVILRVARSLGGGHDTAMDRYAFVLDSLKRDDYKRLRAFIPDGRGSFDTWLAVVARRLCMDEHRQRYGRAQSDALHAEAERVTRRQLVDLVGNELGLESLEGNADGAPDLQLERAERRALLDAALRQLDVSDRLILRLRFEDVLSVPEIARVMGVDSPFKIYRRLEKALAAVRSSLEAAGIRDASH
jgi:RNA polymerase sigma factor (sigma-70 family)